MAKLLVVFLLLTISCQIEEAASHDAKPKEEILNIIKEILTKIVQTSSSKIATKPEPKIETKPEPKIETKPESKPDQNHLSKPHPAPPPADAKQATNELFKKKNIIKGFAIPLGILKSLQDVLST